MHCMNFFYTSNSYLMGISALKALTISKLPARKKMYKLIYPPTVLLSVISLHLYQFWYHDFSFLLIWKIKIMYFIFKLVTFIWKCGVIDLTTTIYTETYIDLKCVLILLSSISPWRNINVCSKTPLA